MRGIGDVPQPDRAVVVAAGQRVPVGAERHRHRRGRLPPVRGWPSGRGCAGSATSHSRTVPSSPPLASVCPPGLNATDQMAARAAGQGLAERAGVRGIGDVPQPDRAVGAAAGQRVPVGAERHRSDGPVLPVRGWPSGRGCAGSATSHSRTVPSSPPLASVRPSGLNATESTARSAAGQGLAERAGVRGIGDVPQPDRAIGAAAGQRVPVGAERHRDRRRRRCRSGRSEGGSRAGWCRRRCRWPACARRG